MLRKGRDSDNSLMQSEIIRKLHRALKGPIIYKMQRKYLLSEAVLGLFRERETI